MQKRKRLGSYVLLIKNILTIVAKKWRKNIICNKWLLFSTKVNKETKTKNCDFVPTLSWTFFLRLFRYCLNTRAQSMIRNNCLTVDYFKPYTEISRRDRLSKIGPQSSTRNPSTPPLATPPSKYAADQPSPTLLLLVQDLVASRRAPPEKLTAENSDAEERILRWNQFRTASLLFFRSVHWFLMEFCAPLLLLVCSLLVDCVGCDS